MIKFSSPGTPDLAVVPRISAGGVARHTNHDTSHSTVDTAIIQSDMTKHCKRKGIFQNFRPRIDNDKLVS
jgi:hypothetical protein